MLKLLKKLKMAFLYKLRDLLFNYYEEEMVEESKRILKQYRKDLRNFLLEAQEKDVKVIMVLNPMMAMGVAQISLEETEEESLKKNHLKIIKGEGSDDKEDE